MQDKHTQKTLDMNQSSEMQEISTQQDYQTFSAYVQDFLAKHFQSLESGEGSKIQEVRSFLKSYGLLGKNNHLFYSSKTSKGYYLTTKGKPLESCFKRWMNWGMTVNGKSLIANISFHKTEREYSLSDILEDQVAEKYYLSEKATKSMLTRNKSNILPRSQQTTGKEMEQDDPS